MIHELYSTGPYDEVQPEIREVYEDIMETMGIPFVPNFFKAQGHDYELLRGTRDTVQATLYHGELPRVLKELIIYVISEQHSCRYCSDIHGMIACRLDPSLNQDVLLELTMTGHTSRLSEGELLAINLASRAALYKQPPTRKELRVLSEAGYTTHDIEEIFALAELANLLNTIADISEIDLDDEVNYWSNEEEY